MALLSTSQSLFFSKALKNPPLPSIPKTPNSFLYFSKEPHKALIFRPTSKTHPLLRRPRSSASGDTPDPDARPPSNPVPELNDVPADVADEWGEKGRPTITDEWGEKAEPEPEYPKAADSDPPRDEDEWEERDGGGGNGSATPAPSGGKDEKVEELKRCLVDTVYGTDLGFAAGGEIRAEVSEIVNQLEALNPNPAPVETTGLLDGKWILVYTAFSELLPLLAAGATPLLKVKSISQDIDTSSQSIVNSTTLTGPFASFSFSATATFEVRSPSRIQVQFKEGELQPPEIKSSIDLPTNVDLFGQKINLAPVQQSLNPLQEAVATISRTISGQPPLKLPIPGNRAASWLLITYLDEDFRISRGDGGLFVLVKEGSPLLYQ
ncbi:hypothetical protein Tsubulata_042710 [Turnera subulata]|uniref:Plastid lipid-associated protein/fibrillin conserved domain-containing protein n=1 Tax=Turnera subulata TaxID=218843 RepID=A0A9Q0FYL1_9ROSI|nr:hypothetical protein Tsubulata_042710 [Turnera subulata]